MTSENDFEKLKKSIEEKDAIISDLKKELNSVLTNADINRYSRQILLTNVGVEGQIALKQSSVLIVGAGGLGCPSSLYLAGAGVGHIGIVDYDVVEENNLHRQLLHTEDSIGMSKVESAMRSLKSLNKQTHVSTYNTQLASNNALEIISKFDIVIDATDNVATRYLLNDACVFLSKPLVSGSALQMEGQLTVYNHNNGPCYRCIFPVPPPPNAVTNCGDGGVLGVIPGTIGMLQALETIKIILKQNVLSGQLLLFDGTDCSFRKVKLRSKNTDCAVCGTNPTVTQLIDYEQFCKSKANDKNPNLKILPPEKRITVEEYQSLRNKPHLLVDVRSEQEFKICKLTGSVNIPINRIDSTKSKLLIQNQLAKEQSEKNIPVYVVCRRGNDSQKAVVELEKDFEPVKDIVGGLHAWARNVDKDFPVY